MTLSAQTSDISVNDFTTFMENLDEGRKVIESEEKTNNNSKKKLWSVVLRKNAKKTEKNTENNRNVYGSGKTIGLKSIYTTIGQTTKEEM